MYTLSRHIHLRNLLFSLNNFIITYIPFSVMYKQLNIASIFNIIFMYGAHGVAGWVWVGTAECLWIGCCSAVVASEWLWSCRVWNTAELGAREFA